MSDDRLSQLLARTVQFLRRYVVFPTDEMMVATALWVGHSWFYDQFDVTPYLAIQSPEKGSGKTRLLECLRLLTREPVPMAGATVAALFRLINERHPTLLLDEADTIFGNRHSDRTEDLRGLLNNGYRRGVPFWRVVGEGKKMRVESFDVYCPKSIASIGSLPDTVQDRSVVISLKRRASHEPIERFRFRTAAAQAAEISELWQELSGKVRLPDNVMTPDDLPDRAADHWEPLLALADVAGHGWDTMGRRAALQLSAANDVDDDKVSVVLLADIRVVLSETDSGRITLRELLDGLLSDSFEEHPWQDWNAGKGLTARGLGKLLRPFGIRARQLRVEGRNIRGYDAAQFSDAFARYLPPQANDSHRYTATQGVGIDRGGNGVAVSSGAEASRVGAPLDNRGLPGTSVWDTDPGVGT